MASQSKFQREEVTESSEIEPSELTIQLPDFILGKIFSYLDNSSKLNVALTCKRFNSIVKSDPEVHKTFNPEKRQEQPRSSEST